MTTYTDYAQKEIELFLATVTSCPRFVAVEQINDCLRYRLTAQAEGNTPFQNTREAIEHMKGKVASAVMGTFRYNSIANELTACTFYN